MLRFDGVTLRRGPRELLTQATLAIHPGQRVGLVGRNGTGKSSLFAMMRGVLAPDLGDYAQPAGWTVAWVAQETPALQESALEFVLGGDEELATLRARLATAEAADDGLHIAELHDALLKIDGHAGPARAARLLDGLGFASDVIDRPVASFSGGWRMRLNLARALMCRSDLMLLDEPTNHLDLETVLWLQDWLISYRGTLLVISHDRDFLDAVTSHTLHLHNQQLTLYTGNYSAFERMRAEQLTQQAATHASQQRRLAHLQQFVDRFRAQATKARQAQSRMKMIERIERIAPVIADSEFSFSFQAPAKAALAAAAARRGRGRLRQSSVAGEDPSRGRTR
jgi:ATPase components of ABC transporters with duplicated ATPase domains